MATEATSPAPANTTETITKVSRPDEEAYKKQLAKLQKEHDDALSRYNAAKAKLDSALPKQGQESPLLARKKALQAQADEIRAKQGSGKAARSGKMEQIKSLDEQLRRRITEQNAARSKVAFKNVGEIDVKIKDLERDVESGKMKLVDEKKALAEISSLRKLRKNFSTLDNDQKAIDDLKEKIKEIKDSMESPEAKALSEEYSKVQAELTSVRAELDSVFGNLTTLRSEKSDLHSAQQATWTALKKLKDDYHTQRKAAMKWEREAREKRREREQAERDRIAKERKMARAQEMLAEASDPAFAEQIRRADTLVRFFDPSHAVEEKAPLLADKGLGASAQRKVDASGFEGMKLVRKEDRDDDYLPAVKKGKKGKKSQASETPASKFSCPPSVIEDCTFVGVNPPMSAAEVPEVIEKVKAKIAQWKADQPAQTQKNIEKAKKEIERLEAEESAANSGSNTPGKQADGEKGDADQTVTEAAEKVAEVSITETSEAPKEVEATA
ncbi:hypothetical protein B0I37DRAFT_368347 [Chaetomium sp. MPI-CAGE-AT-0009]|nr:hypothetical protein B0I37DRAFT_368347 [Chaetomium sp. MPI-CAGE-AT-0009]